MRVLAIEKLATLAAFAFTLQLSVAPRELRAQSPVTSLSALDIDRLVGPIWSGTLEYRDYNTNKQTTIRSTLAVLRLPPRPDSVRSWELRVGYNDEPNENSRDTALLSTDGRMFRGERVMERAVLPDGALRFQTEMDGMDNDRPARFRFVYLISENAASIQKTVRYDADGTFFERHIYRWTR